MPYRPSLQSAPELRGDIGDPSAWSGSSTSTPTISGTYTGTDNLTYTFTAGGSGTMTIGTTASIPVTWSDGTESGRLNLGTDADYSAGDVIPLDKGMSIAFGAGTVIAAETFTLAVVAAYRLRRDHREIKGDADPVVIDRVSGDLDDGDEYFETDRGDVLRYARAAKRDISLDIQHCDEVEYQKALYMAHERHPLTVFENYGKETLISYRGGTADDGEDALLPVVGPHLTFTRSGVATYQDADTGLWRSVADGIPRFQYGPEVVTQSSTYEYERLRDGRPAAMGRAITVSRAATNLCPYFHADANNARWTGYLGGPTITWNADVAPPLDPSDSYWDGYSDGCQQVYFSGASEAVQQTSLATISGSTRYTGQAWMKGRGSCILQLYTGTGSISGAVASTAVTFTGDDWHRVVVTGVSTAGHNVASLVILSSEATVIHVSAIQIEVGPAPSAIIKTEGASATRNAESLTVSVLPPITELTLSGWYWHAGDDNSTDNHYFVKEVGKTDFALRYTPGTNVFKFNTASAGALSSGTYDVPPSTWTHVSATMQRGTAGTVARQLYVNGALSASDSASTYWDYDWGNSYTLGVTSSSPASQETRLYDVRLDARVLTATEILDLYNRVADNTQRGTYMETGGRRFYFKKMPAKWTDRANPDKLAIAASLYECGANRDALIVSR